ncbi:MAG: hypothetical protein IIV77_06575 [Bacteroidaceae bacterium]|nr:hypothetical protein [Bacteroidaceae bacterium]
MITSGKKKTLTFNLQSSLYNFNNPPTTRHQLKMSQNTSQANNKRIAKNTLMLYVRMLISMAVGLYTSRIILQVLGVEDYGIYGLVGGLVGVMIFHRALWGALDS